MHTWTSMVIAGIYQPYDYESITVSSSAVGLTAAKYKPVPSNREGEPGAERSAARAVITVETNELRYRYDGTDPTTSEGHILGVNDVLTLVGDDAISQFRAIATGSDGVIKVTYER